MRAEESPAVLACGEWTLRGAIKVWVAIEEPDDLKAEPAYAPAELIACPACQARMTEHCRTRDGRYASPHDTRLLRRVCACGGPIRSREDVCRFCRAEIDREVAA